MQPSKEQWGGFKNSLSGQFGAANLVCDGFLINIAIEMSPQRKLVYMVYVNNKISGKWIQYVKENAIQDLPEESSRFYRHSYKSPDAKFLKLEEKIYGKRKCKKKGLYLKRVVTMPYWNNLNSLVRHLKQNNQEIELIDYEEYSKRVNNLTNDV